MRNGGLTTTDKILLKNISEQAVIWAHQAGQIAMGYFNNATVKIKADNSLQTKADVEIESYLVNQIHTHYPTHGLIGEEGTTYFNDDAITESSPYLWAIDPLDGTTTFVKGLPGWGISLGLLYHHQPVFGLFYMPLINDLTYATLDTLHWNDNTLEQTILPDWGQKGFLAISAGAHHDFEIEVLRSRALGSVGASLTYTARGTASAALVPKAYLWDIVAGGCLINRAGGELRYLSGKPINYQTLLSGRLAPEPILAGHPNLLNQLQQAIQPRDKS